ncbi:hypothetical protein [Cytobacillus sp. IB215665]|uniref:hypothetical protein n=1 Tax=Cytobacillus sp. IB215665 TaxID=3097357 RepID=UPI0039B728E1
MMEVLGYPLQTIYLYCLIGGGILTVIYILFGDILDGILDVDPGGYLNPSLLLSFFTIFSAAGYLLERLTSLTSIVSAIISFVTALVCSIILHLFVFVPLKSAESSITISEDDLKGRIGKVIISIPKGGYGEVILEGKSGNIAKSAQSFDEQPIASEQQVIIIDVKSGVLQVAPYEENYEF